MPILKTTLGLVEFVEATNLGRIAVALAETIKRQVAINTKSVKLQKPAFSLTWRREDGMLVEEGVGLR